MAEQSHQTPDQIKIHGPLARQVQLPGHEGKGERECGRLPGDPFPFLNHSHQVRGQPGVRDQVQRPGVAIRPGWITKSGNHAESIETL